MCGVAQFIDHDVDVFSDYKSLVDACNKRRPSPALEAKCHNGGLAMYLASRLARLRRRPAAIPMLAQRLRDAMLHHHPAALTVCSALLCLPALSPLL